MMPGRAGRRPGAGFFAYVGGPAQRRGQRVVLMVLVDGDNVGVQERKDQLAAAAKVALVPARSKDDPVLVLVPTWSIETWLAGLVEGLSEAEPMKPLVREPAAANFAQAADRVLAGREDEPLPSLRAASAELRLLPDFG